MPYWSRTDKDCSQGLILINDSNTPMHNTTFFLVNTQQHLVFTMCFVTICNSVFACLLWFHFLLVVFISCLCFVALLFLWCCIAVSSACPLHLVWLPPAREHSADPAGKVHTLDFQSNPYLVKLCFCKSPVWHNYSWKRHLNLFRTQFHTIIWWITEASVISCVALWLPCYHPIFFQPHPSVCHILLF